MKKLILTAIVIFFLIEAFSQTQWVATGSDIYFNEGKVGIGTNNPSHKLSVISANSPAIGIQSGNTSDWSALAMGRISSECYWGIAGGHNHFFSDAVTGDMAIRLDDPNKKLYLGVGNGSSNAILTVTSNSIGIGTTTPQAKLAVNGDIFSKKIKVTQTGWPDYVFEPTYRLPSLQEVEAYIKKHKRLPEVPSAQEVEKKGLDLGETQAVLLKKIEELTLYIIELEKRIKTVEKQLYKTNHKK